MKEQPANRASPSLAFARPRPLIGVVHVLALPGTPGHDRALEAIIRAASQEAGIYRDEGIDGILVENMHDVPYLKRRVGPEIVASMTAVAVAVRAAVPDLPLGIQILAGANRESLAVAQAAGLDFVRAEGFVFAHVADEGMVESCAGEMLRYRRAIGAERVQVWADVKKKHSAHAMTADVSLAETVQAVEFFRGDAVIVTGRVTGDAPALEDLVAAKGATRLPVLLGSGITPDNLARYWEAADGFIIGSYFKEGGSWANPVDPGRVREMVARKRALG
jgi:membrane complex biogenesis BtpA family protein